MKQTAIITGGNSGIGAAIAFEMVANGIDIILLARDVAKLEATANQMAADGGQVVYHRCDVTKRSDIEKILATEAKRLKDSKLILINNAGYGGPFQRTDEMEEQEWDIIFDTNVKAAFLFCKSVLPLMKEAGWGRVINIASVYGSVGGSLSSAYAASKHALIGYTKSIAAEWGVCNITCNTVSPGFTDTKMGAANNEAYYSAIIKQIPAGRQGTPAEIAASVRFLCSETGAYINGADIVVDGGLLAARSFR